MNKTLLFCFVLILGIAGLLVSGCNSGAPPDPTNDIKAINKNLEGLPAPTGPPIAPMGSGGKKVTDAKK